MLRRFALVALTVLALGGAGITKATTAHAQTGGGCELTGTANFTNPGGLSATPSTSVTYTFTGTLSNCQSTDPTLKSGTVTASGSATAPGESCEGGTSAGSGTITWNTGTPANTTAFTFTTTGVGAAVVIQATVGTSNQPAVPSGSTGGGVIAFQTTTPQNCASGGLTSATFTGATFLGTPDLSRALRGRRV